MMIKPSSASHSSKGKVGSHTELDRASLPVDVDHSGMLDPLLVLGHCFYGKKMRRCRPVSRTSPIVLSGGMWLLPTCDEYYWLVSAVLVLANVTASRGASQCNNGRESTGLCRTVSFC